MEEKIYTILEEIRPEADFRSSGNYIKDGLLDSFDIIVLIDNLEQAFHIEIDFKKVEPEYFFSVHDIIRCILEENKHD